MSSDDNFSAVFRQLSAAPKTADGNRITAGQRIGRYGEPYVVSLFNDQTLLADEGSFFVTNNGVTGIATQATPTAFSATNPFISIFNRDAVGGKRIYLDHIVLNVTAIGTAGASVHIGVTVDAGNRFTSGGTALTPLNANMDESASSIATINSGDLLCAAATAQVRRVVGDRVLKGAIPVVSDEYSMKFGWHDSALGISTIIKTSVGLPPVIIGPQQTFLLHLWLPSQSAASSYEPEIRWIER